MASNLLKLYWIHGMFNTIVNVHFYYLCFIQQIVQTEVKVKHHFKEVQLSPGGSSKNLRLL